MIRPQRLPSLRASRAHHAADATPKKHGLLFLRRIDVATAQRRRSRGPQPEQSTQALRLRNLRSRRRTPQKDTRIHGAPAARIACAQVTIEKRDGGVAVVTLDRPTKLNALDMATFRGVRDAAVTLRDDADVRAVVIRGAGRASARPRGKRTPSRRILSGTGRGAAAGRDVDIPRATERARRSTADEDRRPSINERKSSLDGVCPWSSRGGSRRRRGARRGYSEGDRTRGADEEPLYTRRRNRRFSAGLDLKSVVGTTDAKKNFEELLGRPEGEAANLAQARGPRRPRERPDDGAAAPPSRRVAATPRRRSTAGRGGDGDGPQAVSHAWRGVPCPVVAAVHGVCFGGGFQIALGADVRVAAAGTKFSVMEAKWGLIPDMGATAALPELVNRDVAIELTTTGRIFEAAEAKELGLVTKVVEGDAFEAALGMATKIAAGSPDAAAAAKQLWHATSSRGAAVPLTRHGDAAAATRRFRGRDAAIPRPRRGDSAGDGCRGNRRRPIESRRRRGRDAASPRRETDRGKPAERPRGFGRLEEIFRARRSADADAGTTRRAIPRPRRGSSSSRRICRGGCCWAGTRPRASRGAWARRSSCGPASARATRPGASKRRPTRTRRCGRWWTAARSTTTTTARRRPRRRAERDGP